MFQFQNIYAESVEACHHSIYHNIKIKQPVEIFNINFCEKGSEMKLVRQKGLMGAQSLM